MSARVTILDVARRAHVSAGTVSNALTGKRPVSERTRQRILAAIDDLGYQPNLLARGLVNRRSATLGVVASGLEFFGPARVLMGVEAAATALGYSLLLDLLHRLDDVEAAPVLNDLTAWRVDGILWAVPEVGDNRAWIDEERLHQLPPIAFLTMQPRPNLIVLATDNRGGAALAVEHLTAQGCRRIGILTGPLDWWEARERLEGWRQTLERCGLEPLSTLVVEGDWSAQSGEAGLRRLLAQQPDLDAIFACNDLMALGVLHAAHRLGIRVPQQLAVVGFDNVPEAAYFSPSLTSVRQHLTDLGRLAIEALHALIEARAGGGSPPVPASHLVAPELFVRESSGGA